MGLYDHHYAGDSPETAGTPLIAHPAVEHLSHFIDVSSLHAARHGLVHEANAIGRIDANTKRVYKESS